MVDDLHFRYDLSSLIDDCECAPEDTADNVVTLLPANAATVAEDSITGRP